MAQVITKRVTCQQMLVNQEYDPSTGRPNDSPYAADFRESEANLTLSRIEREDSQVNPISADKTRNIAGFVGSRNYPNTCSVELLTHKLNGFFARATRNPTVTQILYHSHEN